MNQAPPKPSVLFVCAKNGGKSQMAAALMRHFAGADVLIYSAGTKPGKELNPQSVESMREIGVEVVGEYPKPIADDVLNSVNAVIVLGSEAKLAPQPGKRFEVWETDEPSTRGIEGMERMRLVRDDIRRRVEQLHRELTAG